MYAVLVWAFIMMYLHLVHAPLTCMPAPKVEAGSRPGGRYSASSALTARTLPPAASSWVCSLPLVAASMPRRALATAGPGACSVTPRAWYLGAGAQTCVCVWGGEGHDAIVVKRAAPDRCIDAGHASTF